MKKRILTWILLLVIVFSIPSNAEDYHDTFESLDELLSYWEESGTAGLKSAVYFAIARHKDGENYVVKYDGLSYSFTEDEFNTILQWLDGQYILTVADDAGANLINADVFFYNFNFYAAFLKSDHILSVDNADEISSLPGYILHKTIFNQCEILSLELSKDAKEVRSVRCTWAKEMPNSQTYLEDFLTLLMESVLACGLDEETATQVFEYLGSRNNFNIGDSDEMTIDGVTISYTVERGIGVSFKIEKQ